MHEDPALSGLVVVVPEAEPVVGHLRSRLDENAALGGPAHVTVLFPFGPPGQLDEPVLTRLSALFAEVPSFDHRFSRTGWFGDDVRWLAPVDPAPFRDLTTRVVAAFPQHLPFEGAFGDLVVPHLTVGHRHPRPQLAVAEREVLPHLPVAGRATEVVLLTQLVPGGRWSRAGEFPLSRR